MRQQIAAMTVVRGRGECKAFMDGIVNAELEKVKAEKAAADERRKSAENHRDRLLQQKRMENLRELKRMERIRNRWYRRIGRSVERAWVCVFCVTMHAIGRLE